MEKIDSKFFPVDRVLETSLVAIDKVKLRKKVWFLFFKRLFDLVVGSIALFLVMPIILIVALLIKLEEPKGPILFSQIRIGKDEKKFRLYKIRSMCVNAEEKLEKLAELNEVQGAMFKMKADPRITRIGKVIRKLSIDELPQLWNVIKGDMSLIGPRPPLPREVSQYKESELQRLLVKPGCTGLWQVSGRNNLGFDEMVNLDLSYIENLNVKNDLKIFFKTLKVLLFTNGAY